MSWRTKLAGVGAAVAAIAFAGAIHERIVAAHDAKRFPPPGRRIDVGGRSLHIVCAGEGSPTVVLEAGGTHDSMQYAAILPTIAQTTRTCAYDRAGMGWSDPSPHDESARSLAADLDRMLVAAGERPPYVLVAGSAGGLTAELFAREHPDRVAGLVMLDALDGRILDEMPDGGARLVRRACFARALAHVGALRLLDPFGLRREPDAELRIALGYRIQTWDAICDLVSAKDTSADQIRRAPPPPGDLELIVLRHDRVGELAGVAPDEQEAAEPRWQSLQARFAAQSSRGEVIVARGSGHSIVSERPDLVRFAIEKIVRSVRARDRASSLRPRAVRATPCAGRG